MKIMKMEINKQLEELNKQFKKLGKKLYVVGGYTRDYLLGEKSLDIDICSSMTPTEIKDKIKDFDVEIYNNKAGSTHISKDGITFEHTTFRIDYYHDNGEHTPYMVEFTDDIYTDSFRRDFSINSIYYDIQSDEFIDFYNGINDIKERKIKTIVSPDYVFGNDGLRLLRMVRFACQLNFSIDEETFNGARRYIYQLADITPKRISDEILKILSYDNKFKGIKYLIDLEGFKYIFSGINTLPLTKKIDELLTGYNFKYLTEKTDKDMVVTMFLIEIIKLCYSNIYDKNVTLNGITDFILNKDCFVVSSSVKEKVTQTLMFFEEYKDLKDENEKKAIILDYSKYLKEILYLSQIDLDNIEVYDIVNRLKNKNIALELSDFCLKNSDMISLGLKGKNISIALNDMFLYSVVYEINDKEILVKVLEKLIKERKYG